MNIMLLDSTTITNSTLHNSLVSNNDIVDEQFQDVDVTCHFEVLKLLLIIDLKNPHLLLR